jgi:hypothetical protein
MQYIYQGVATGKKIITKTLHRSTFIRWAKRRFPVGSSHNKTGYRKPSVLGPEFVVLERDGLGQNIHVLAQLPEPCSSILKAKGRWIGRTLAFTKFGATSRGRDSKSHLSHDDGMFAMAVAQRLVFKDWR